MVKPFDPILKSVTSESRSEAADSQTTKAEQYCTVVRRCLSHASFLRTGPGSGRPERTLVTMVLLSGSDETTLKMIKPTTSLLFP